jgi:hypothetical protein
VQQLAGPSVRTDKAPLALQGRTQGMPLNLRNESDMYQLVAGCVMVALILFGLLELMDVVHV